MFYSSLLLSALLLFREVLGSDLVFQIRHKMSRSTLAVCPEGCIPYQWFMMVSAADYYDDAKWTFEQVDGEWGYLRNWSYGSYVYPFSESMTPAEDEWLGVYGNVGHPSYRFALDQVNNRIIHYGGKYLHPSGDLVEPPPYTEIVLKSSVNDYMEFELTDPNNPDEIILPYGYATIAGDWVAVFSVENALAAHTYTVEAKIGKSASESIGSSFQFVWEGSAGCQAWFVEMSSSASLANEIEQSSSQTWMAEITVTNSIVVEAGASVTTWQKHFIGEQLGHKAVHQSNFFYDTESPDIKPGDDVTAGYYL